MPELPEVEKAADKVRSTALGKQIEKVETTEDALVFSGISDEEFAKEVTGRTVATVGRRGKVFYIELDGEGRMPVLHFGMTGTIQIKGESPTVYKDVPRKTSAAWPPRFMKFILHIRDKETGTITELAFCDARRLGRIRLCTKPLEEPPISTLGFDPIISMPTFDEFKPMVIKRNCPIKALLLDQSFSAGVGNWVADEILYHARIHPEQRCNTLTEDNLRALHTQVSEVCRIAVEANADDSKFPDNWLFKHRWGKGKGKKAKEPLELPSGEAATIKWITVGGRTSAYVVELQVLQRNKKGPIAFEENDPHESDLTPLSDQERVVANVGKRKRKTTAQADNPRRTRPRRAVASKR